jgi:hypothetical protein
MMSATPTQDFIDAIAQQMSSCADKAVERWMAELDSVLDDPALTTLGRLQAVAAVVARYKMLTGKTSLPQHSARVVAAEFRA